MTAERPMPPIVDLTPAAVARARELLAHHGTAAAGIRLGVKTTGCSGMSYKLDFADAIGEGDTVIEKDGVKLVVSGGIVTPPVAGTTPAGPLAAQPAPSEPKAS